MIEKEEYFIARYVSQKSLLITNQNNSVLFNLTFYVYIIWTSRLEQLFFSSFSSSALGHFILPNKMQKFFRQD